VTDSLPFPLDADETLIASTSVRRYAPAFRWLRQQHHGVLYLTTGRIVFQRILGGRLIGFPLSHATAAATEEIVTGRYGMSAAGLRIDFDTGGAEYFIPNPGQIQVFTDGEFALSFASGEPTNQLARAINAARSKAPPQAYTVNPGPKLNPEAAGRAILIFIAAVFACLCLGFLCMGGLWFALSQQSTYP
jgi:hypothetical protein